MTECHPDKNDIVSKSRIKCITCISFIIEKSNSIVKYTCLVEDISMVQTDCVELYKDKYIAHGPNGGNNWSVVD